jgi:hypothetical protein
VIMALRINVGSVLRICATKDERNMLVSGVNIWRQQGEHEESR